MVKATKGSRLHKGQGHCTRIKARQGVKARQGSVQQDLVEVVADDLPDARPLETDTPHVVVRDLDDLLKAEHARACNTRQLLHGHGAQSAHKLNCAQYGQSYSTCTDSSVQQRQSYTAFIVCDRCSAMQRRIY